MTLFEHLLDQDLVSENYFAHLWSITWNGMTYSYGWRTADTHVQDEMGLGADKHIDEQVPRHLMDLEVKQGQTGTFSGSISFSLALAEISSIDASNVDSYPKITLVPCEFGEKLEPDWISSDETEQCVELAGKWRQYYETGKVWKRVRSSRQLQWVEDKPKVPPVSPTELDILGLLINADCKFKECWTNILKYALPDRQESKASAMFSKLKGKESYMIENQRRGLTKGQRIQLAKVVAQARMQDMLTKGPPVNEIHPLIKAEQELRKHGRISDETDQATKKQKIQTYVLFGGCGLFLKVLD